MLLLDVETDERATLVLGDDDDDDERLVRGTLVDGVAEVDWRAKIGLVHRLSRSVEDHERYELDEPELDDDVRDGGHGSSAGFPGIAGAESDALP